MRRPKPLIKSYAAASAYLGTRQEKRLPGRSTWLCRRTDGSIRVRYHHTDVVTYRDDGAILVRSGGYTTLTTKTRINTYAPIHVYQKAFEWFYFTNGNNARQLFYDGLDVGEKVFVLTAPPVRVKGVLK